MYSKELCEEHCKNYKRIYYACAECNQADTCIYSGKLNSMTQGKTTGFPGRLKQIESSKKPTYKRRRRLNLSEHEEILKRPLVRYKYEELPSCVYFLLKGCEVVYIGQSTALPRRIQVHQGKGNAHQYKDFDEVFFIPCPEVSLRKGVEAEFIKYFKPKYNGEIYKDADSCFESVPWRELNGGS